MKKLVFAIVFALFLSGCESGEVQRRMVVHAIGIDRAEEGYEVSYQIFSGGESSDSGPVDASEETVKTLLSVGRSLTAAEESLELQTGKDVFLGDVELILISEELKDEDISQFLQYFRNVGIYLGVNVCYCRGKARDTVGAKLEQGAATAILLRSVVERAVQKSRACSARIIEISNTFADGEAVAVPILTLEKSGDNGKQSESSDKQGENSDSEKDTTVSDTTIGVFDSLLISKDGIIGEADELIAQGIRLLKGNAEKLEIETEAEAGKISVKVSGVKIKRKIEIKDNRPLLRVFIEGEYDIRLAPPDMPETEVLSAAETRILELCKAAAEKMSESGADLVNVKKMLEKYHQEYAEAVKDAPAVKIAVFEVSAKLKKY